MKLNDVRTVGHRNRYQWSRPHDSRRAQLRRMRQIIKGQLSVPAAVEMEAQSLILEALTQSSSRPAESSEEAADPATA
jgi:hypothetical protein